MDHNIQNIVLKGPRGHCKSLRIACNGRNNDQCDLQDDEVGHLDSSPPCQGTEWMRFDHRSVKVRRMVSDTGWVQVISSIRRVRFLYKWTLR